MTSILVTRPGGETDPLVRALAAVGLCVYAVPTVATQPLEFDLPDFRNFDWVVLTSVAGVDALAELPAGPRWAAVGGTTARALLARGVEPALVPHESNGLAVANALPDAQGKHVLLVRASGSAADLPTRLRERGAEVVELVAYVTVEGPASSAAPLLAALSDTDLAAVVFASGSAVRGFIALAGTARPPAITIGPRTTAVARQLGFRVIAEARGQSVEALLEAVVGATPVEQGNGNGG